MGSFALLSNTTGYSNSAFGVDAMRNNTTGSQNTAYGVHALYSNTIGRRNTAVGYEALFYTTSLSSDNTAVGYLSLRSNTSGENNSALGAGTLYANTTGEENTAVGINSLGYNTVGWNNVGIGNAALRHTTSASYNIAMGYAAGAVANMGWNNTMIGSEALANADGTFNSIALGADARVTASNQARIGNSSTTSIGGFAGWTNISDGRFKKNIKENVRGLDFILQLRPVTYNLDIALLNNSLGVTESKLWNDDMQQAAREKEQLVQSGFIAQEVEAVAKSLGYNFSGIDRPRNEKDLYGLRYAEFVVPLVKAMQEQQALITALQKQVNELSRQLKKSNN